VVWDSALITIIYPQESIYITIVGRMQNIENTKSYTALSYVGNSRRMIKDLYKGRYSRKELRPYLGFISWM
jgi:hypothetical protein